MNENDNYEDMLFKVAVAIIAFGLAFCVWEAPKIFSAIFALLGIAIAISAVKSYKKYKNDTDNA